MWLECHFQFPGLLLHTYLSRQERKACRYWVSANTTKSNIFAYMICILSACYGCYYFWCVWVFFFNLYCRNLYKT